MSIVTSSLHSLYNKLPSLTPSAISNAAASTASSTYNLVKDGFYSTLGKVSEYKPNGQTLNHATSAVGAHPYLSVAGIVSLIATGIFINTRRQATQATKKLGRQTSLNATPKNTTGISVPTMTRPTLEKPAVQKTNPINPTTKVKPEKAGIPSYISDRFSGHSSWKKLQTILTSEPESIKELTVFHLQKANTANIQVMLHGYHPGKPDASKKIFSFDIVSNKLPQEILLDKIYKKDRLELGKLIQAKIPSDIPIYRGTVTQM